MLPPPAPGGELARACSGEPSFHWVFALLLMENFPLPSGRLEAQCNPRTQSPSTPAPPMAVLLGNPPVAFLIGIEPEPSGQILVYYS